MDVFSVGAVGVAAQLVGLVGWWLRLWWQARTERERGLLAIRLAYHLSRTGGQLRERRADGSVLEVTVPRG